MSELMKLIDGYRRFIICKFDKNYAKNKLKKRRGKCKKCGKCCKGCPFLNKKTHLCKIYKNRPALMCYKDFPLDKFDQEIWSVEKTCGYSFD